MCNRRKTISQRIHYKQKNFALPYYIYGSVSKYNGFNYFFYDSLIVTNYLINIIAGTRLVV